MPTGCMKTTKVHLQVVEDIVKFLPAIHWAVLPLPQTSLINVEATRGGEGPEPLLSVEIEARRAGDQLKQCYIMTSDARHGEMEERRQGSRWSA